MVQSFYFEDMATGRFPMLPWMPLTHACMDSVCWVIKKEKDIVKEEWEGHVNWR